jgi:uncharacterized protein
VLASFRFYGPLNDFLPPARKQRVFVHALVAPASVKDVIESLGVPHPEVDLIVSEQGPVGFDHLVADGEHFAVYPRFTSLGLGNLSEVRPSTPVPRELVLDGHLGRLAAYLRALGIDTWYENDADDATLAAVSHDERRVLLTRDIGLLKRAIVEHGYWVRTTAPAAQLVEIIRRFDLHEHATPFSRCVRCNGRLEPVEKGAIEHRLLPRTRERFNEFVRCPDCDGVYWKGSHYERMQRFLRESIERARQRV